MRYNSNIKYRKSIRLKGYDYSKEGLYFITICTQNRENLFGKIIRKNVVVADQSVCNENADQSVCNENADQSVCNENADQSVCNENADQSVCNENADQSVCYKDADQCVYHKINIAGKMIEKWIFELLNKFKNINIPEFIIMPNHIHFIIEIFEKHSVYVDGELIDSSIPKMIQWFKTMTTNEYIKMVKDEILPPFNKRIWQRNYYEKIIRNEEAFVKISEYIKNNPLKWLLYNK